MVFASPWAVRKVCTAQALPGFEPDLTVMGKVIGGGMPLAAFGGRRDVMQQLARWGRCTRQARQAIHRHGLWLGDIARDRTARLLFSALSTTTKSLVDGLQNAAKAARCDFAR